MRLLHRNACQDLLRSAALRSCAIFAAGFLFVHRHCQNWARTSPELCPKMHLEHDFARTRIEKKMGGTRQDHKVNIRQTVPCRAIRGSGISVNSTLPPSYTWQFVRETNVHCAFGISLKACLLQCLLHLMPVSNSTSCGLGTCEAMSAQSPRGRRHQSIGLEMIMQLLHRNVIMQCM